VIRDDLQCHLEVKVAQQGHFGKRYGPKLLHVMCYCVTLFLSYF